MNERDALLSAVRNFNGHTLDWRRVYLYVSRRSKSEFTNPMGIDEITSLLEETMPGFSDQLWRFIESGTEMLEYLRDEGRI